MKTSKNTKLPIISTILATICMAVMFVSCEELFNPGENNPDENLLEQETPLVTDRFPARNQTDVDTGIVIWIELASNADVQNVKCEISQYPLTDSAWYTWEGIEYLVGPPESQTIGDEDHNYDDLFTESKIEGNRIYF